MDVKYWQIWNEPDFAPTDVGDEGFGCWGNPGDPYYGGGAYAEFLKLAARPIHDSGAQLVMGGLALDCGPTCARSKFFEGVLRTADINSAIDVIDYHSYADKYDDSKRDWDKYNNDWSGGSGILLNKLYFLRGVMQRYGVNKPIIVGEAALRYRSNNFSQYISDQANYVIRFYTRAWANGIAGVEWYSLSKGEHYNTDLIDGTIPRAAYRALAFLSGTLKGSSYFGQLPTTGTLEGYAFYNQASGKLYHVYWNNAATAQTVVLPATPIAYYDEQGNSGSLNVQFDHPLIVDLGPITTAQDDAASGIAYTGSWESYSSSAGPVPERAVNTTLHKTSVAGSKAKMVFNGNRISYLYSMSPDRGTAIVRIDGIERARVSAYVSDSATQIRRQIIRTWDNLSPGNHTIEIEAVGDGAIDLDMFAVNIDYATAGTYGNNHPLVRYTYLSPVGSTSNWTYAAGVSGAADNDLHYTNTTGDFARFTFVGSAVTYVFSKGSTRNIAGITIDGVPRAYIDTYNPTTIRQQTWDSGNLGYGIHTIHIQNRPLVSGRIAIDLDRLVVR